MNLLTIETKTGALLINEAVIAPLAEEEFLKICTQRSIEFSRKIPMQGRSNYGAPIKLRDKNFGLVLSYESGILESAWMTWLDAVSAIIGYDTTDKDLLKDLSKLQTFIAEYLKKYPDEETFNHSVFWYSWGRCSCSASLQLQSVGLGLRWGKKINNST